MEQNKVWLCSDLMLSLDPKQREKFKPRLKKKHHIDLFYMWESAVSKDDAVVIFGNVAGTHQVDWHSQIKELPGRKLLFISEFETNRPSWYKKFNYESIVPFGEALTVEYEPYGNILLSALPAFHSVLGNDFFFNTIRKIERAFDVNSCVLNIHGYTNGKGKETSKTFDACISANNNMLLTLDQIVDLKFKGNKNA